MITLIQDGDRLKGNPAVAEFLAGIDGVPAAAPLPESGYVDLALAFASLRLPAAIEAAYNLYLQLLTGRQIPDVLPGLPVSESEAAALCDAQARFVQWLESIRHDRPRAVPRVASALSDVGNRLVMRPTFLAGGGTVEVSYQCLPADFDAALGFVVMLLVDRSRPFMGNVCRCKYAGCQRYFLAVKEKKKIGRPRRDYCSRDHFDRARAATAAERIRDYRQKVREKRKRSTRRKGK